MACTSCSPGGCGDKGHCATGGCNKMNTYDWISVMDLSDPMEYPMVEVSFKNGANKEFYINEHLGQYHTGDYVLVEASSGYDIGKISLMGELVRLQMKKKGVHIDRITTKIIRRANDRDLEKLDELRKIENASLVRSRSITYSLNVDMKVSDVQYQGDGRKATFYYTANGRIDFRDLVKEFAREFKVKIEMRQIGSRQESARIGGIGSCGRELCCSTWLSDFRSVNTSAARYQNIAINQTKLSGQCGRLKCCLNYELDSYMDALQHFPNRADHVMTKKGRATLMKTDIFRGVMYYSYDDINMRGVFHPLDKDMVKEILSLNAKGVHPEDLSAYTNAPKEIENPEMGFADVTGQIELPSGPKSNRKKKKSNNSNRDNRGDRSNNNRDNRSNPNQNRNDQDSSTNSNVGGNESQSRSNNNRSDRPERGPNNGPRPERGPRPDREPRPDRGPKPDRGPRPERAPRPDNNSGDSAQRNTVPSTAPNIQNNAPSNDTNQGDSSSNAQDSAPKPYKKNKNFKNKDKFKNRPKPSGGENSSEG